MPVSSSDGRGKWKRRKRDAPATRKPPKREDPDEEDEDDEDEAANNNHHSNHEDSGNPEPSSDPGHQDPEVLGDGGTRVCDFPHVTRMQVNRPHASVLAVVELERANSAGEARSGVAGQAPRLENVSYGQLQAVSAVPAEGAGPDQDGGIPAYVISPPKIMEGRGVVERFGNRVHVVPMHSDWFSPSSVHRLERQAVPHFFSGKSPRHTPEKYMECRNHIVAKYMSNPEKRVTVSDCQGLVVGVEEEDLIRIMRFLDHWGIINYCAAPPARESWNGRFYLKEEPSGEVHVPSAALKSIDSLIKFDKPKCRLKAADVYTSLSCHDDDIPDLDSRIREHLSENSCHHCSRPIVNLNYQSQKEVNILLCPSCFLEGRFVAGHSSVDFVLVDSRKDYGDLDGETWTDQETLLLLEAMEIYNESWNEIADYVGTKSKAQCILHFLRLPIEDGVLDNIDVPVMSESSNGDNHGGLNSNLNGSCAQDAETESKLPFANSGNPLMSLASCYLCPLFSYPLASCYFLLWALSHFVVSFLASAVGPRVAAACAHASLAALAEDDRTDSERSNGGEGNFHDVGSSTKPKDDLQHGLRGESQSEATPLSATKVKVATKVGLSAAAMKAKLFADHEEREIQRLSANIINHQLKRLELKLKQFAEVETFLMRECEQVEKTRQRFAAERARIQSTRVGGTSQMNLGSISPSMGSTDVNNSRQQMMPASASPSSISGYTANPQVHPHMSFMQRGQQQPMFPLGPRLPLSAIQPSSDSSNAGFNNPGNSQPNLNQMLRSASGPRSGLG